jgi:hypothetical protein
MKSPSLEGASQKKENLPAEKDLAPIVQERYEMMLMMKEVKEALALLDKLPDELGLVYHVKDHTLDVIHDTVLFAVADNVTPDVLKQQSIAAAWHDMGFLTRLDDNESLAVDAFQQSEAFKRMSRTAVWETIANIWDTRVLKEDGALRLTMKESTIGYVLDGDVSNFGRPDFFEKMNAVAKERKLDLTNPAVKKAFLTDVISLLENHEWRTEPARRFREATKQENLEKLRSEYAMLVD